MEIQTYYNFNIYYIIEINSQKLSRNITVYELKNFYFFLTFFKFYLFEIHCKYDNIFYIKKR